MAKWDNKRLFRIGEKKRRGIKMHLGGWGGGSVSKECASVKACVQFPRTHVRKPGVVYTCVVHACVIHDCVDKTYLYSICLGRWRQEDLRGFLASQIS